MNKELYVENANNLENWQQLSKSDLCNLYISSEDDVVKQACISALIVKCWNIFNHNYKQQPYINKEEWYESMIEAILYTLDQHAWTKEDNVLYNDPKGPEKALHRCIWSRKLNTYERQRKNKRKINKNILSTEAIKDNLGYEESCELNTDYFSSFNFVHDVYKRNPVQAYMIYLIINYDWNYNKISKELYETCQNTTLDTAKPFLLLCKEDKNNYDNFVTRIRNLTQSNIDFYMLCLQRSNDVIKFINQAL